MPKKESAPNPGTLLANMRWAKASKAEKSEKGKEMSAARNESLSPERRIAIAKKAAAARWGTKGAALLMFLLIGVAHAIAQYCGIGPVGVKPVTPVGCTDTALVCLYDAKGMNPRYQWACVTRPGSPNGTYTNSNQPDIANGVVPPMDPIQSMLQVQQLRLKQQEYQMQKLQLEKLKRENDASAAVAARQALPDKPVTVDPGEEAQRISWEKWKREKMLEDLKENVRDIYPDIDRYWPEIERLSATFIPAFGDPQFNVQHYFEGMYLIAKLATFSNPAPQKP